MVFIGSYCIPERCTNVSIFQPLCSLRPSGETLVEDKVFAEKSLARLLRAGQNEGFQALRTKREKLTLIILSDTFDQVFVHKFLSLLLLDYLITGHRSCCCSISFNMLQSQTHPAVSQPLKNLAMHFMQSGLGCSQCCLKCYQKEVGRHSKVIHCRSYIHSAGNSRQPLWDPDREFKLNNIFLKKWKNRNTFLLTCMWILKNATHFS